MSLFAKKPPQQFLAERLKKFRAAVYDAAKTFDVPDRAMITVLEDIALYAKMAIACTTAPPGSTQPKFHSGNVDPPKTPLRTLARRIAGLPVDDAA
jgi:hypothetical protein